MNFILSKLNHWLEVLIAVRCRLDHKISAQNNKEEKQREDYVEKLRLKIYGKKRKIIDKVTTTKTHLSRHGYTIITEKV